MPRARRETSAQAKGDPGTRFIGQHAALRSAESELTPPFFAFVDDLYKTPLGRPVYAKSQDDAMWHAAPPHANACLRQLITTICWRSSSLQNLSFCNWGQTPCSAHVRPAGALLRTQKPRELTRLGRIPKQHNAKG